jgi:hypothetical protein
MKTPTLLRITSVLAFVQFAAHTAMFVTYVPSHGAEEVAVVEAMKAHVFKFGATAHSYWDLYFGYGLMSAANCLVEAVLFWLLAVAARQSPALVRSVAALFLLANVGHFILVRVYFFPLPGWFDLAIAALLGAAIATSIRAEARAER